MKHNPLVVEVLRGSQVESLHQVMAVVVDAAGTVVDTFGDGEFLTFPRSAIKMLQALPLIETGAADHYHLNDKEICMACASHGGEPEHIAVVSSWLARIGLDESALACGAHKPANEKAAHALIRGAGSISTLMNNCSGKHTGFLTTCRHLGEDYHGYEVYDHPVEKRLRQVLTETMRVDHEKLAYGIDGCSIVTYATPLKNIAIGMSALINPAESSARRAAAQRILHAVRAEPFYLAGSGEFTSLVTAGTGGRSVVKTGAEGVYAGLIPEKGLAFALKALDGHRRASEMATAHLLRRYGGMTDAEADALKNFTRPAITNWRGEVVGSVRCV